MLEEQFSYEVRLTSEANLESSAECGEKNSVHISTRVCFCLEQALLVDS